MTRERSPATADAHWCPESHHTGDLLRLRAIVTDESGCRFVIAVSGDSAYRDRLIRHLDTLLEPGCALDISGLHGFDDFDAALTGACATAPLVHVTGFRGWLSRPDRATEMLHGLNYRRERLAARCTSTVVFWLDEPSVQQLARRAPDFWAWRAGLLSFMTTMPLPDEHLRGRIEPGAADATEVRRRLDHIRSYLQQREEPQPSHLLLLLEAAGIARMIGALDEAEASALKARKLAMHFDDRLSVALAWGHAADILEARGELDEALRIRHEEELPVYERLGSVRERAISMGKIADVLVARGELDEALRIRREEELPVFERLDDVHSRAITTGKIADVLAVRGELDEALRIRREEELPVYDRFDDARSRAITMGKVADVLLARGELDEALRIRHEEELPIYERLGDVRLRAIAMGRIADVLHLRGELNEALRIRREEQLPVFQRLGDVHQCALTMGQIADVLQARGELDEALRIRREEELPVYEQLGDVREHAVTMGKIADVFQLRGDIDEALRIRRDEQLPVYEWLGDVHSHAVTMGKIADALAARGELDEALRIRRDEQLPVYERLGDKRSHAVTMGRIADVLAARGELDEALRIRRDEQLPVYERLGDVRGRSVTLQKIGLGLLAIDPASRVNRQAALDALAESFSIARKLDDPWGMVRVGVQLAETLVSTGKRDAALGILADTDSAAQRLGSQADLQRIADTRQRIFCHGS